MTKQEEEKNGNYIIKLASSRVKKQLDSLPPKEYNRIREKILYLSITPRPFGVKKLSDKVYRIRIGKYRVIYSIFDKEKLILIDKVDKRKESTYKGL
jgi:mRNA interferase RelE/StbE